MAKFEDVIEQNKDALVDVAGSQEHFSKLSAKLGELGFDVLINNKKDAEFIPSSRLSEVVSQRDNFKSKVEDLNTQLESLKKGAGDNETLKAEYQAMINKNNDLLAENEQIRVNSEIMIAAKDAINAKDLLVFIEKGNIKVNSKGEVLGIDAEIARLKKDKPYLFTSGDTTKKGGQQSNGGGKEGAQGAGMNAMIRKAAGRL